MILNDVLSLSRKLIALNTVNPLGNEHGAPELVGKLLSNKGFKVEYITLEKNRLHAVAEKGCSDEVPPVVFTVPS